MEIPWNSQGLVPTGQDFMGEGGWSSPSRQSSHKAAFCDSKKSKLGLLRPFQEQILGLGSILGADLGGCGHFKNRFWVYFGNRFWVLCPFQEWIWGSGSILGPDLGLCGHFRNRFGALWPFQEQILGFGATSRTDLVFWDYFEKRFGVLWLFQKQI